MLFTSISFALFLTTIFFLYWFVFNKNLSFQNIFLLLSSYVFYGWWDWRFLFLLLFISISNYAIAILIQEIKYGKYRKIFFLAGLLINTGVLVFFKYFNFFVDGFVKLTSLFGLEYNHLTLNIILPLGISFYIFLSISYIIDVYRDTIKAERNLFEVLLTLSFFPIILAGPIQRPATLLPQIKNKRIFSYDFASDGLRQILWGLFMKIVIADKCGNYVDEIFKNYSDYPGSTLLTGAVLFSVQIYADFAGYSNIAIGIGKLFGFNIMKNFAYPYFSRDIGEFWKRWNISLTTWFRDYVFLPIAYSFTRRIKSNSFLKIKKDLLVYIIGITITWILTGLWHGANYTFIVWGLIQGFFLVQLHAFSKPKKKFLKKLKIKDSVILVITESILTLIIVMFSLIFFKAESISQAGYFISKIFSVSILTMPSLQGDRPLFIIFFMIFVFFVVEWLGRKQDYAIANIYIKIPGVIRWAIYYVIIFTIFWYSGEKHQFIYFQF